VKTTRENLLRILLTSGILSEEQVDDVRSRAELRTFGVAAKTGEKGERQVQGKVAGGGEEEDLLGFITSLRLRAEEDRRKVIGETELYQAVADGLGLPFQRIDPMKLDFDLVTQTLPRRFAARHYMVPLGLENEELTLATADPFDGEGLEVIARSTGFRVKPVVATRSDILKIITEFYGFKSAVVQAEQDMVPSVGALSTLEQYVRLKSVKEMEATDQHVVNAVDFLFNYAFDQKASDIHLEPKRERAIIRFRIDGVLHTIHSVPTVIHPAMASRIKMLSRLDIAERRRPQDGRIKVAHQGRDFEMRVSTLPTAFGEKVVLRIFDPEILLQDLALLGFSEMQLKRYRHAIGQPHGVVLLTGPTGSGKTTTLYSSLNLLSTDERNVTTIEDPIEMIHESFNQVGVQPQIGLTFDQSLRHILRQDPDVIMVGEIRDGETAGNAIQAALTGHLVLSTLHTNDAPTAVTRLVDMGVPHYLVGTTLLAVAAQRLVRRICKRCVEKYTPSEEELSALAVKVRRQGMQLTRGKGCSHCRFTGYHGRTAIFEVMSVTPKIRTLVHGRAVAAELMAAARREKMRTLRESGLEKVSAGVTTIEEVLRVTMRDIA
jgi:general secretion pathway protein E